jgi:osmotically-inducible protein OsmY
MPESTNLLHERVQTALQHNPHFHGRQVHFRTEEGRVVLSGEVRSFYHKQMAQEVLRRVEGIEEIENQLQVNWS